jgi:FkbM family methyltransferase
VFEKLLNLYRMIRVKVRIMTGTQPDVPLTHKVPLEFHGNDYCGWGLPVGFVNAKSVIADVGVGEDISFSTSLISRFGCTVHGFDPTPRAKAHVQSVNEPKFKLHEFGLSDRTHNAEFHLPSNEAHVSGSLISAEHLKGETLQVKLIDVAEMFRVLDTDRIDILKIDIEGSEYDVIGSEAFASHADRIGAVCLEFHHRWPEIGPQRTLDAVKTLNAHGFKCAWASKATNEEFTFVRA